MNYYNIHLKLIGYYMLLSFNILGLNQVIAKSESENSSDWSSSLYYNPIERKKILQGKRAGIGMWGRDERKKSTHSYILSPCWEEGRKRSFSILLWDASENCNMEHDL